jgi:hypothetical protein
MELEHYTDLGDDLAVGSYPQSPEQILFLRDNLAVGAVVNLQSDTDLRARGIDWSVMWPVYTRCGLLTSRVPIRDFAPADLAKHLDLAVQAIGQFRDQGRKVYVHCNAGLNRSPSVIIAHLVASKGLSVNAATKWLEERHDCVPYPDVLKVWAGRHGHPL